MPTLTIFAGINGAGKSTLYEYEKQKTGNKDFGKRVNPDEILLEFNGDWSATADQYKSGRIALQRIKVCLENKESFNWETTVLSYFAMQTIKLAKSLDYTINLFFIGVNNVQTSLSRINKRIKKGGHGIDKNLVISRFNHQYDNIQTVLKMVDKAIFYDNSLTMQIAATYVNDKFTYINLYYKWTEKIIDASKNK
ncbi:MAG: ATPase [Clostridiales bacterium]|nr:ATPase [Clostridiales bacterium]